MVLKNIIIIIITITATTTFIIVIIIIIVTIIFVVVAVIITIMMFAMITIISFYLKSNLNHLGYSVGTGCEISEMMIHATRFLIIVSIVMFFMLIINMPKLILSLLFVVPAFVTMIDRS